MSRQNKKEDVAAVMAREVMRPEIQAASTICDWDGCTIDFMCLSEELSNQTDKLKDGDMHRAESMLLAQAQTLNSVFNSLARTAKKQEYAKPFEMYLRLAFKAQSQCRATLETLSNIKNLPVVFAKQANIANRPQQINNGVPATHTEEIKKSIERTFIRDATWRDTGQRKSGRGNRQQFRNGDHGKN